MQKRQVVVSSISEITNQLKDMADDMFEDAVLKVDKLSQQWNDLSKMLTSRKAMLEVNKQLSWFFSIFLFLFYFHLMLSTNK